MFKIKVASEQRQIIVIKIIDLTLNKKKKLSF